MLAEFLTEFQFSDMDCLTLSQFLDESFLRN